MNLYLVCATQISESDWWAFAFAPSASRAKTLLMNSGLDYGSEYINYRARLIRKDVGGEEELCASPCDRLKLYGVTLICRSCEKPYPDIGSCECGCDDAMWDINTSKERP